MPEDVTNRSHNMSRGASLLYANEQKQSDYQPDYRGVLKLENGETFWVGAWERTVKGKPVIEIKLTPKP